MVSSESATTLRLVEEKKPDIAIKDYRRSSKVLELAADGSGTQTATILATCDVIGNPLFTGLEFQDSSQTITTMRPNRGIMPSAWRFMDPRGQTRYEIKRVALFRAFNPFSRRFFYLTDITGQRQFILEDLASSWGDLWFGSSPREWSITEQGEVRAMIRRQIQEAKDDGKKKGWFGGLKNLFRSSNWVLQTPQSAPLLPAPVFIGLMVILHEHTQNVAA